MNLSADRQRQQSQPTEIPDLYAPEAGIAAKPWSFIPTKPGKGVANKIGTYTQQLTKSRKPRRPDGGLPITRSELKRFVRRMQKQSNAYLMAELVDVLAGAE
ncbi:MAG: hypothetical protein LC104_06645 [Bacteroidales bacterium]|nr:hypothetical protein [Bacteroidales bacterium]